MKEVDHQYVKVTSRLTFVLGTPLVSRSKLCEAELLFDLQTLVSLEASASPLFPRDTCSHCLLLLNTMAANGLELDLPGYIAVLKILEATDDV